MKICKKCGDEKIEDDFYETSYVRKDGTKARYHKCKSCQIKASAKQRTGPQRDAYLAYQQKYHKVYDRTTRLERLKTMDALKAKPCGDCGQSFPPECMDFDHKDPKKKLFTISNAVVARAKPWDEIMAEIAKCRLICSNCHRIRTALQQRRGCPERSPASKAPPGIPA